MEIDVDELSNGKYAKIYSSSSELIKVEIVLDERTAENLYKGYISEINLIQDNIILRNPKVFADGKWEISKAPSADNGEETGDRSKKRTVVSKKTPAEYG